MATLRLRLLVNHLSFVATSEYVSRFSVFFCSAERGMTQSYSGLSSAEEWLETHK